MSLRQILQNGTTANDGTGDSLRDAADKINNNFRQLFIALGDSSDISSGAGFDSDGRVRFDGGAYSTFLGAENATSVNKYINLPDAGGTVVLQDTNDTLTNKTVSFAIQDVVLDSAGDRVLQFAAGTNATNYAKITNGDSASGVSLAVVGDSASVDLCIDPQNNGVIKANAQVVPEWEQLTENAFANPKVVLTFLNRSTATGLPFNIVLPDGANFGEVKKFVSLNDLTATITPTNFAHVSGNNSVTVAQFSACEFIWTGTNWHLISTSNTSDNTTGVSIL